MQSALATALESGSPRVRNCCYVEVRRLKPESKAQHVVHSAYHERPVKRLLRNLLEPKIFSLRMGFMEQPVRECCLRWRTEHEWFICSRRNTESLPFISGRVHIQVMVRSQRPRQFLSGRWADPDASSNMKSIPFSAMSRSSSSLYNESSTLRPDFAAF